MDRIVRRIFEQTMALDSVELKDALEYESLRRVRIYSRDGMELIPHKVGDFVQFTGEAADQLPFPVQVGQIARVTGLIYQGYQGILITVDEDGDIIESKFLASQVKSLDGLKPSVLN